LVALLASHARKRVLKTSRQLARSPRRPCLAVTRMEGHAEPPVFNSQHRGALTTFRTLSSARLAALAILAQLCSINQRLAHERPYVADRVDPLAHGSARRQLAVARSLWYGRGAALKLQRQIPGDRPSCSDRRTRWPAKAGRNVRAGLFRCIRFETGHDAAAAATLQR
jgi:hypothetical protein